MPEERQALLGEVGLAMQRYQRSVQAFDDAVGRALGVGPSDVRCLDWLADGAKSVSALATATGLRAAATSAMVDRLERRGLVARSRPAGDRRQVLVAMTDEGRELTDRFYRPLVVEGHGIMDALDADRLRFLRDLLASITALTDRHRADVPARAGEPVSRRRAR